MNLSRKPQVTDAYYWRDVRRAATDNHWMLRDLSFEKDGYEVFFRDGDFLELTIRHPDTSVRTKIIDRSDINFQHPAYVAILKYLLHNAENLSHLAQEEDLSDTDSYLDV